MYFHTAHESRNYRYKKCKSNSLKENSIINETPMSWDHICLIFQQIKIKAFNLL
jgi:hypothetical protein